MSYNTTSWAIEQRPKLPTEKLVLIALANCHNRDTNRCDPSLLTLCKVALCSERTAIRAVESLEKQGLILTQKQRGKRTKYTFVILGTTDTGVTPEILAPVTPMTQTPDTGVTTPLTPVSPKQGRNKEGTSKYKYSPDDLKAAEFIYNRILLVAPKTKKPNLERWSDTIRKMRQLDNLSHREIAEVFAWANKDKFWNTIILSPENLRDKFAKLHAQSVNNHENNAGFNGQPTSTGKRSLIQRTTDQAKQVIAIAEAEEARERAMDPDDSIVSTQVAVE